MKINRTIIEIDRERCDGCGQCVRACHEGALALDAAGKAVVVAEVLCDGLGDCIGECPQGALTIIQREAAPFDPAAVAARQSAEPLACGCPGTQVRGLEPAPAKPPHPAGEQPSHLGTWPIQLRLVPPDAPFLHQADLLIAADCTGFACTRLHRDFLQGRVLLVGCPKLDDAAAARTKLAAIFSRNPLRSVTLLVMEVPCCQSMRTIVADAQAAAGTQLTVDVVTIDARGQIVQRDRLAA